MINKLERLLFINGISSYDGDLYPYYQNIEDNFLNLVFPYLNREGYLHYKVDFITSRLKGKYYRVNKNFLEVGTSENNIVEEGLKLNHIFSKICLEVLKIPVIEGYKSIKGNNHYFGYFTKHKIYEVRVLNGYAYIKFNLHNIFLSLIEKKTSLAIELNKKVGIIALNSKKSGVVSYNKKLQNLLSIDSLLLDDDSYKNEKEEKLKSLFVPLIIYAGEREMKNKTFFYYDNGEKISGKMENIDSFAIDYLKKKSEKNFKACLKENFEFEKEGLGHGLVKVNMCEECSKKFKYVFTPFNRLSKVNTCQFCNKENKFTKFIKI